MPFNIGCIDNKGALCFDYNGVLGLDRKDDLCLGIVKTLTRTQVNLSLT